MSDSVLDLAAYTPISLSSDVSISEVVGYFKGFAVGTPSPQQTSISSYIPTGLSASSATSEYDFVTQSTDSGNDLVDTITIIGNGSGTSGTLEESPLRYEVNFNNASGIENDMKVSNRGFFETSQNRTDNSTWSDSNNLHVTNTSNTYDGQGNTDYRFDFNPYVGNRTDVTFEYSDGFGVKRGSPLIFTQQIDVIGVQQLIFQVTPDPADSEPNEVSLGYDWYATGITDGNGVDLTARLFTRNPDLPSSPFSLYKSASVNTLPESGSENFSGTNIVGDVYPQNGLPPFPVSSNDTTDFKIEVEMNFDIKSSYGGGTITFVSSEILTDVPITGLGFSPI